MKSILTRLIGAALALGCAALATSATAAWPDRPLRIIVPNPPGGVTDLAARILTEPLNAALRQPVVIENHAGAGGIIAASEVARAPADGYTLLLGTSATNGTNASTYKNLPYNPQKDFEPVTLLSTMPLMIVVNPSVPVKTLPEFIQYLKANPGKVNYGSTGSGGFVHLSTELFAMRTGTSMEHIVYKGSGPAQNDLLGGHIQVMFDPLPSAAPLVEAGKVRALGVTSRTRTLLTPDLPTVAESAVPGFEALTWLALYAPAGTPPDIVRRLNEVINSAFKDPAIRDSFRKVGMDTAGGTPQELVQYQAAEIKKWTEVVKAIKYEPQ